MDASKSHTTVKGLINNEVVLYELISKRRIHLDKPPTAPT